jgi:hypothetical protein
MTANTRLKLGIALTVGGNLLFFTSAWIAWMPWPASFKAALWGVLFFAPEVGTLAGVAIMGRENFERFKTAFFAWIGRIKPAGDAYKPQWLPDSSALRWQVKIAADVLFLASFFVLGGDFWDKLHALFTRDARASQPPTTTQIAETETEPRPGGPG